MLLLLSASPGACHVPNMCFERVQITSLGMAGIGRSRWLEAVPPRHLMCYEIFETRLEAKCRRMQRHI
jgi:hypothetical protein